jgi:hypothetical protein
MDLSKMLAELKAERDSVEQAIMVLERITTGRGKGRGRPPKWMTRANPATQTEPKKRTLSPESRARMAAAQRKRWAKVKKARKSRNVPMT